MTLTDCSASRHVFISVFTEFRRLYRKGCFISSKNIWGGARAPMVGKVKGVKYRCEAFVRDVFCLFFAFCVFLSDLFTIPVRHSEHSFSRYTQKLRQASQLASHANALSQSWVVT